MATNEANCLLCSSRVINGRSSSQPFFTRKATCCGAEVNIHQRCLKEHLSTWNLPQSTTVEKFQNSRDISLNCFKCETNCFQCGRKHSRVNSGVSITLCNNGECSHWCWLSKSCSKKMGNSPHLCSECNEGRDSSAPLEHSKTVSDGSEGKNHNTDVSATERVDQSPHTQTGEYRDKLSDESTETNESSGYTTNSSIDSSDSTVNSNDSGDSTSTTTITDIFRQIYVENHKKLWCLRNHPLQPVVVKLLDHVPDDNDFWHVECVSRDASGQHLKIETNRLVDSDPEQFPVPRTMKSNKIHHVEVKTKKISPYQSLNNPNKLTPNQSILYRHLETGLIDLQQIHEDMSVYLGLRDGEFKTDFASYKECVRYIKREFSDLDDYDNIFLLKPEVRDNATQLFLSKRTLERLICQNRYKSDAGRLGWLDDEMINFMSAMCNFYISYNKEKNQFQESTDLLFGNSWDDRNWVTPQNNDGRKFKVLRTDGIVEHQHLDFNFNRFVCGIRDWFNSETSRTFLRRMMSRSIKLKIEP